MLPDKSASKLSLGVNNVGSRDFSLLGQFRLLRLAILQNEKKHSELIDERDRLQQTIYQDIDNLKKVRMAIMDQLNGAVDQGHDSVDELVWEIANKKWPVQEDK